MKPIFEHDCTACVYLGSDFDHDFYICSNKDEHPCLSTLIARYGVDGDYSSGLEFCWSNPYLNKALELAFYKGELWGELYDYLKRKQHEWFLYIEQDYEYKLGMEKRWAEHPVQRFILY